MVQIYLEMYVHVCTWYVHGMYIPRYKHVCTLALFRHVCTCLYHYIQVLNHVNMYIQSCTNLYIKCYVAHVQCTNGYRHFIKCTDIAEPGTYIDISSFWLLLFYSPGWLACMLGLAAARCHAAVSSSSTLV
jgi:hypothetical protein